MKAALRLVTSQYCLIIQVADKAAWGLFEAVRQSLQLSRIAKGYIVSLDRVATRDPLQDLVVSKAGRIYVVRPPTSMSYYARERADRKSIPRSFRIIPTPN